MKRQAYRINKAGNINRLKLVDETISAPKPTEVQVAVKAIGLNFADIFAILGLYSATPEGSFVPGLEYCGVVEKVGDNVDEYSSGDRVMGVIRFGGYANKINIDQDYVTLLPDHWTFEEGAAFLVQSLTAYYGLFRLGNLNKGDTVLIHSAAGGVGLQANRMAQKTGAYTIGTVGSKNKIDLLKKEGYQDYLVRDKHFKKNLSDKLKARDLNLVMECIGGSIFKAGYNLLAPQGRVVIYGSARYGDTSNTPNWLRLAWKYITRPKIDPQKMIETNKAVLGFNLIWLYHKKALMKQIIDEMNKLKLPPPHIGHRYQFDEMYRAIKHFQSGKTMGKVVVQT
ncbi:MAG: medium chain dehydrogenase/reductase family protein [Fulvivirga sp.]|nr:medium chain dehydrogenase/reductase family protein [Fulvivirga sp.]